MRKELCKKRVLSALLLSAVLLSGAACGSEKGGEPVTDTGHTDAVHTDAPTTEEITAIETEEITTEAETDAITEAVTDFLTKEIKPTPFGIMPQPIIDPDDVVDEYADYNNPKVKFEEIVDGLVTQGVYVGRDGWMFYQDCIEDFTGTNLYKDIRLERIAKMLQERSDWCEENGMKFYFMVTPNKSTIYPEKMPSNLQKGETSRLDQVYDYLKEHTTVKVIDVRDALFAAKEEHPDEELYYALDTHWNNHGGYYAYQCVMDAVCADFPNAVRFTREDYQIDYFPTYFKDNAYYLGYYDAMLSPGPVYTKLDGKRGYCVSNDANGGFGQFVHAYEEEGGFSDAAWNSVFRNDDIPDAPSIYVVHDSFYIAMRPFFRDSFSDLKEAWTTEFPQSSIKRTAPDIVLFQCVEAMMHSTFGSKTFG